jgi:hypothetical protein
VTWEGRPAQPNPANQLPLTLTLTLGASVTTFANQVVNASGVFTVPLGTLPAGSYTWRTKGPLWLANSGTVTLSGAPVTTQEMGVQRAGDVNSDNLVDVADFTLLRAGYGLLCNNASYEGRADYNGDCVVDVTDFTLLRGNFGQTGAP